MAWSKRELRKLRLLYERRKRRHIVGRVGPRFGRWPYHVLACGNEDCDMDVGVLAHGMFVWPKFPTSTSSPTCTYCGEVWLYDDFDRWLARNEAELAEEEDEADGTP